MKRKIFLFLILSMLVFMTGCTTDTRKENKHILDFLLNNVVDDNGRTSNNQFYMFSKDGKFIYNKSTKVRLNKAKSILFIKGI